MTSTANPTPPGTSDPLTKAAPTPDPNRMPPDGALTPKAKLARDRRAARKRFFEAGFLHVVLIALAFTLMLPFVWMLLTSVRHISQVGLSSWIPAVPTPYKDSDIYDPDALAARVADDPRLASVPLDSYGNTLAEIPERLPDKPWDDVLTQRSRNLFATALNNAINFAAASPEPIMGVDEPEGLTDKAQELAAEVAAMERTLGEALQKAEEIDVEVAADPEAAAGASATLGRFDRELSDLTAELGEKRALLERYRLDAILGKDLVRPSKAFQFENYLDVFKVIPFGRFYINSIFIACCVTFLQVLTSSLAAFAFARLEWPFRDKVFLLYLATMMLPGLVMILPNFQIMIYLGLVDTMIALVLPASFTAFGTFLLRQFMLTIPRSMDEAAAIDGASPWRVYWDVILPMARPGLVTLAIFTFMGAYHNFFWPLVILKSEFKYTLPIGLLSFDSSRGQETNLMMAAVTMSVIPMIIVFVTLQKQLVKGIQLGAVKG
jgi:multiple sugar transport system permease protein